jgi:tetratricopeptide (TPR) repeat protein
LADDTVDSDSAKDSGEHADDEPKKTFGILAARFLQKGKSSPGSVTGEFEAMAPPSVDSKVRNSNPIDDDDDDVREGSIHGIEVPLNESLYADIGLDDMPNFGDPGSDSGEFSAAQVESNAEVSHSPASDDAINSNDVVYDIDADEAPVISVGSSATADVSEAEEYAAKHDAPELSQPEEFVYDQAQSHKIDSEQENYSEPKSDVGYSEPEYQPVIQAEPELELSQPMLDDTSLEYASTEYKYGYEPEASEHSENSALPESAAETSFEPQAPGYDFSALDSIGAKNEVAAEDRVETDAYDKNVLNKIGADKEELNDKIFVTNDAPPVPEKKGLLGKFAAKKDPSVRPLIGGAKKEAAESAVTKSAESTNADQGSKPYDSAALNEIGTKSFDAAALDQIGTKPYDSLSLDSIGTKPYDPSSLDSIGTKPYDPSSLDSIGTKPYDPSSLDAIGTKPYDPSSLDSIGTKPYDPSSLDSIGTKPYDPSSLDSIGTKPYDPSSLDAIGTKPYDPSSLDSIGTKQSSPDTTGAPPETPADAKDKPAKGGLLGGKIGQKAKVFGSEKPKLGGGPVQPPSTGSSFEIKDTGRFMVSAVESYEALHSEESLSTAPQELPQEPGPAVPEDLTAQAEEPMSGSFFDASVDATEDQAAMPVIPGDEVGRLITDADNAFRMKQYKAAEPIFASVLEKLDKAGDDTDPLLPYCLDKMSDNFVQLKRYKEALQLYRRLLVLQTKISSADRDMISTLYKIAQTSEALNLTSEADSMYKRAFRLGQQSLVPGDPLLAKVLEGYGTMLMRSEGSEPPAVEGSKPDESAAAAAARQSALSADEIKMLNELNIKSEAEAKARGGSEGSPIILAGGPIEALSARDSKNAGRAPLRETDERADKVRASGPSSTGSGAVWIRLGVFLAIIAGLVAVTLNMKSDFSSPHVTHSPNFQRKVYKTLDSSSTFAIVNEDEASKDSFGKHFKYEYKNWNGSPSDDVEVISGQVGGDNFIYEIPQGIRDGSGFIYYDLHAPENTISAKMRELGNKAQTFYKAKGKYPEGKELDKVTKSLTYKNPFGDASDSVTANSIGWPANLDATQVFVKSRFDTSLEDGLQWEGEPKGKPGQISAAASSQKQPDASVFYVHGRDRDGALLTRADGKVLVLIYKNGIEVTPAAADLRNEKPAPNPVPLRVTKSSVAVNVLSVLLSYLPIALFIVLSMVFLSMSNKGVGKTKGVSLATFGIIWAPLMVLMTGLTKFSPPTYFQYCLIASIIVFFGGLGWLGFQFLKTQPKKKKKPPVEASSM